MSDPIDTLRNEWEAIIRDDDYTPLGKVETILSHMGHVATPEQRRALLGILRYEVREEWLYEQYSPDYGKYLVLRDQRETTDAEIEEANARAEHSLHPWGDEDATE